MLISEMRQLSEIQDIFDKISILYSRENQTVASVQCYDHNSALNNTESTCTSYDYASYLAYCTALF